MDETALQTAVEDLRSNLLNLENVFEMLQDQIWELSDKHDIARAARLATEAVQKGQHKALAELKRSVLELTRRVDRLESVTRSGS